MKPTLIIFFLALTGLTGYALSAEKRVQLKDLPPAVQKTVQEQTKGAQIKGISQETEDGKLQYEVKTIVNGKTRDFTVDTKGTLLVVEEQASLESIPGAARATIQKKAAGGKVTRVETVTQNGVITYEAAYTKGGKSHEVTVKADGSEVK